MDNYSNNVIRIIIQIIIRNVIRITFVFGQNRLISEHNIDKNYIFIQRNQNFEEYMFSLSSLAPQTKVLMHVITGQTAVIAK